MKQARLNRLFNPTSHRCFDVAVDHGFFNQAGFLQGIENMADVVKTLVDAGPDAIQLTVGQARHLQSIPGKQKPALILRTDVANVYGKELLTTSFSKMIDQAMLQAVRFDATCVCVNLFHIPGAPEVHAQCVDNILRLKPEADYYGMPMMVEPLVFRPNAEAMDFPREVLPTPGGPYKQRIGPFKSFFSFNTARYSMILSLTFSSPR
jgi:DhnA family fructose-bisphosphate aldolase class Ia